MSTASLCLQHLAEERHTLEDYQGGVPRWCKGCGDNAILTAMQRLCRDEGPAAGEDRVRVRHRLLEPAAALHAHLRLPRHPRPCAADRARASSSRAPTCTCS